MAKSFDDLSLKKLITLIKTDIGKKENKIAATGIIQKKADGTVIGLENINASLVELAKVATTGSYEDLIDRPTSVMTIITWSMDDSDE